jgi:ribosomal protein L12E/L44/L45/RPP1/RPP2/predicted transcriptional regulator
MKEIFYAALALHIAGKPVSKENIRIVLKAAGTPVNEAALDATAAFAESLEVSCREKERPVDPRIAKLLASELTRRKRQTKQLETLLEELTKFIPSVPEAGEAVSPEMKVPPTAEEMPAASGEEALREKFETVVEAPVEKCGVGAQDRGRYVYGIAGGKRTVRLGQIGIEDNEVYSIPYQDLSAIVHNCPPEPYQSQNDETVKRWVRAHQNVLDEAKKVFGTIIPLGFDTILQPRDHTASPDQVVRDWLKDDYERLNALLEKIKDKDEYGVQVSYEPGVVGKQIAEQSDEVRKIKEEMATKSPGMAYMYRQKLEQAVKAEMEKLADEWFKDFYRNIKQHTEEIVVEKTKKLEKGKVMLLNLSCLVTKQKVESLGEELEKIDNMEGFSARFTGPWPPYSFVAQPVAEGG